jgi:ATP-dependent RNA helicase SUPV3L1/SUV3
MERVRKAAYNLPQVLKPADFACDAPEPTDEQLHHLGLILLQKAAAGARPSRWIAPAAIDAALAHLDAFEQGAKLRAALNDRSVQLESLGITRDGLHWQRQAQQPLRLSNPDWRLTAAYRTPVDDDVVWAFFRTGDKSALRLALGTPPPWPDADALAAHVDHLLRRSEAFAPAQLDQLLARLQAECAEPRPLAELKTACTRVQDRWEQRVTEQHTLRGLHADLAFQGYPDSFEKARRLKRSVTLFVGPPNSGKTHGAFERLAQARDGCYLAPLRLLALEGRDRLLARGVPCSLLTGEENVPAPDARVVSSTIEMLSTSKQVEVAVIDEAQMIFDASRGWAWTQAIVGVPAEELLIICSAYAVPAIENLLRLCGETCTVRHFERKQHVELLPSPVSVSALRKGDAVVAFSRRDVLMLRDQIGSAGHLVSVIYGALPPEVRRREAERFAQGESDILVATDAIGMGLNLPIRRVLFSTMTKFDGVADRPLGESELHQIAGRAGRFGMHEEGFAGVLKEAEPDALPLLQELLHKPQRAPRNFKAPVAPNWWHIDTIASRLHLRRLHEVLRVFMEQLQLDSAHFQVAELEQMLALAEQIDQVAGSLPLQQRFIYAQAPVDSRTEGQVVEYLNWAASHAATDRAGSPWFLDEVDEHSRLDRMEQALRSCTLWLWLDLRFPGVYGHVEEVIDLRSRLNDGIERQLKGKRPLAQMRRGMRRR